MTKGMTYQERLKLQEIRDVNRRSIEQEKIRCRNAQRNREKEFDRETKLEIAKENTRKAEALAEMKERLLPQQMEVAVEEYHRKSDIDFDDHQRIRKIDYFYDTLMKDDDLWREQELMESQKESFEHKILWEVRKEFLLKILDRKFTAGALTLDECEEVLRLIAEEDLLRLASQEDHNVLE